MAGRRLGRSLVDWAAFAERVSPEQMDFFRAFKAKSDVFVSRVNRYPENLQPIDFEFYKSKIPNKAMVAEFEKAYKSLSVPYPKDKANMKAEVEKDEKEALEDSKRYIEDAKKIISSSKELLAKINSVPKADEMTLDMYAYYYPDKALNPWERPTFWPHTKSHQPENDPDTIR